jgi:hypothetical protein
MSDAGETAGCDDDDDDDDSSGGGRFRGILASIEEKRPRRRLSSSGMVARSSSSSFPRTIIESETTSREGRTTRPTVKGSRVGTTMALTLGEDDDNERCDVSNSSNSNDDDGRGSIAIFRIRKDGMSGERRTDGRAFTLDIFFLGGGDGTEGGAR